MNEYAEEVELLLKRFQELQKEWEVARKRVPVEVQGMLEQRICEMRVAVDHVRNRRIA